MKKLISTKMKIFMTILFIGSITCFISALVVLGNSGYKLSNYIDEFDNLLWNFEYNYSNHHRNFDNSSVIFSENASKVTNLEIGLSSYYADIVTTDLSNNIEITANYDNNLFANNLLSTNFSNGTLKLNAFTGVKSDDVYFRIVIPTSYAGNITIETANGDINLENLNSKVLSIKSLNSDIYLGNNNCEEINIHLTNGVINTNNNTTKQFTINSINSEISIYSSFENLNITNTNGDINVVIPNEMKICDINNISGDINFQTNLDKGFELNFETTSGDFENNSPITHYSCNFNKYKVVKGNPDANIKVKTVTGDLEIN